MPNVKNLQFEVTIDAPAAKVWDTMFGQDTYGIWTEGFCEGSRFEGTWDQGSRMRFLEASGNGMVSEIAESRPHEFISICHLGAIKDGVEDTESDAVKEWAPAYENYSFREVDGATHVVIDQECDEKYEQMMNDCWADALSRLKKLCEGS